MVKSFLPQPCLVHPQACLHLTQTEPFLGAGLSSGLERRPWAQPDLGRVTPSHDFVIWSPCPLVHSVAITTFLGDKGQCGGRVHSRPLANENHCDLSLYLPQTGENLSGIRTAPVTSQVLRPTLAKVEGTQRARKKGLLPIFFFFKF